jgi:hypothetical protein
MEKREYKSMEWIHKAREENFAKTKGLSPKGLIEKTRSATEQATRALGLKIVKSKEPVRSR